MGNANLIQLCRDILEEDRRHFDAMLGIVSRIKRDKYEIFAVSSETGIPEVGDRYDLNAVYCRQVIQEKHTVAITAINGVPGMKLHPLYDSIPCEFYISSPILVDEAIWGTLNYTSLQPRTKPFSAEEIARNEANAAMIGLAIAVSRSAG